MIRCILGLLVSLFLVGPPSAQTNTNTSAKGYRVFSTLPCGPEAPGLVLEMLRDPRIKPGAAAWELEQEENVSYNHALLNLKNAHGKIVDTVTFDREMAWLEPARLIQGTRFYFITVDLTAPMGSYSGPTTKIFTIKDGKIQWTKYRDLKTGKLWTFNLAQCMKRNWKWTTTNDILQESCDTVGVTKGDQKKFPPKDGKVGADFEIHLKRFSFNNGEWQCKTKVKPGYLDIEDMDKQFPKESEFP